MSEAAGQATDRRLGGEEAGCTGEAPDGAFNHLQKTRSNNNTKSNEYIAHRAGPSIGPEESGPGKAVDHVMR